MISGVTTGAAPNYVAIYSAEKTETIALRLAAKCRKLERRNSVRGDFWITRGVPEQEVVRPSLEKEPPRLHIIDSHSQLLEVSINGLQLICLQWLAPKIDKTTA